MRAEWSWWELLTAQFRRGKIELRLQYAVLQRRAACPAGNSCKWLRDPSMPSSSTSPPSRGAFRSRSVAVVASLRALQGVDEAAPERGARGRAVVERRPRPRAAGLATSLVCIADLRQLAGQGRAAGPASRGKTATAFLEKWQAALASMLAAEPDPISQGKRCRRCRCFVRSLAAFHPASPWASWPDCAWMEIAALGA